jgi:hypothetical protein
LKVENNVEKLVQMQLMSQIFKNMVGEDSGSFQLILESLTQAMDKSGTGIGSLGLSETDLSKLGYGRGQDLNSMFSGLKDEVDVDIKTNNITIDEAVNKAAEKYGVEKKLILSVIKQESSFNPNATSHAGAMGLMQLMPGTAKSLGVTNAYDVEQNVEGGTKYLRKLLDMHGNSKELALAAYNAGPGAVKKFGGIPNYKETQNYVRKVMQNYNNSL